MTLINRIKYIVKIYINYYCPIYTKFYACTAKSKYSLCRDCLRIILLFVMSQLNMLIFFNTNSSQLYYYTFFSISIK